MKQFISHIQNDTCLCTIGPETNPIKEVKIFGKGKVGTASLIELRGKKYILKGINNITFNNFFNLKVNDVTKINKRYYDSIPSLNYNTKKLFNGFITAEASPFVNQTIQHMAMNIILNDKIPNYIYQYDAFVCAGEKGKKYNGYNIMEIAEGGDLSGYIEKNNKTVNAEKYLSQKS